MSNKTINKCPFEFGYCRCKGHHSACTKKFEEGIIPEAKGCFFSNGIPVYEKDIHEGMISLICKSRYRCYQTPWELADGQCMLNENGICDGEYEIE